jgi:hypothetical protein
VSASAGLLCKIAVSSTTNIAKIPERGFLHLFGALHIIQLNIALSDG